MILAVPREIKQGENRVSLIPDTVARLKKTATVHVEAGAGEGARLTQPSSSREGVQRATRCSRLELQP